MKGVLSKSCLAILLVVAGVITGGCEKNDNPFIGSWVNEDGETCGITRVVIRKRGAMLLVRMWGACHPRDCYWGEQGLIGYAEDGTLPVEWNPGFKVETQKLSVLSDGRLKAVGNTHFIDDSGRPDRDYTCHFVRR